MLLPKKLQISLVAAVLVCLPLSGKVKSDADAAPTTGRYEAGDDSISLYINDFGQVEGFYERDGIFGEITGNLVGDLILGRWMQNEANGSTTCRADRRGYSHSGRMEIGLSSQNELQVRFAPCGDANDRPASWTLHRGKE